MLHGLLKLKQGRVGIIFEEGNPRRAREKKETEKSRKKEKIKEHMGEDSAAATASIDSSNIGFKVFVQGFFFIFFLLIFFIWVYLFPRKIVADSKVWPGKSDWLYEVIQLVSG